MGFLLGCRKSFTSKDIEDKNSVNYRGSNLNKEKLNYYD